MRWDQAAAYARLGRVSNLPTCLSNTLVGCVLGAGLRPMGRVAGVGVAVAMLYAAGVALNDVVDVDEDRIERPGRPIPSGRVSRRGACVFVAVNTVGGLLILGLMSRAALAWGGGLTAAFVAYNLFHGRSAVSVWLMGGCRGLIYPLAASAMAPVAAATTVVGGDPSRAVPLGVMAVSLGLYTAGLTYVSRRETRGSVGRRRWVAVAMPIAVLPVAWVVGLGRVEVGGWWVGACLVAWLGRGGWFVLGDPPRTRRAVMAWLAGICLVDAYFLILLDRPAVCLIAWGCFLATVWAHRMIEGT